MRSLRKPASRTKASRVSWDDIFLWHDEKVAAGRIRSGRNKDAEKLLARFRSHFGRRVSGDKTNRLRPRMGERDEYDALEGLTARGRKGLVELLDGRID